MLKLRTMRKNSDLTGVDSTSNNDQRITKVGLLIRKFKIDELGSKYLFTLLYCFLEKALLKLTGGKNVALTMGAQGSISCNNRSKKLFYLPSFTNVIVDTMSAGDAYFVISSMMLYLSKSLKISSFIGNLAGAITVGVAGCVPIDKSKFIQTINTHFKI